MLCSVCKGSGSILARHEQRCEWWPCPCCGGCGARIQFGPPTIKSHARDSQRATSQPNS